MISSLPRSLQFHFMPARYEDLLVEAQLEQEIHGQSWFESFWIALQCPVYFDMYLKKNDSEKDSKNSVRPAMESLCNNDVRD